MGKANGERGGGGKPGYPCYNEVAQRKKIREKIKSKGCHGPMASL